ncbi:hypothetical protein M2451_002925 [Dysgonomonas sp. PFB1-18]|uniref:DUF4280 domain-containing protein n=1 Tax=unclassified Dysgonomonas TaxID=2630389 RepID=UPI0013D64ECF|nr:MULTISPECIES: DUF4280 domain-containing protein [unclassified Dysgonomonas]MDH6310035.1 hypothetical protein [Dysgonomonas sp. PF1-14]MDH6339944.1 hypothetical protein [Dysgonomonas sp. PF1-16]MDH6381592.1 hypothetical protein [Dysgonomonas sp. PFB1-18]MDH6398771.1 hypothetical protein [Dysgonomonas sp. PF1-23]NDV93616.1 DUF4280 domain-containing protein [Dysgonomonas sp. 521]
MGIFAIIAIVAVAVIAIALIISAIINEKSSNATSENEKEDTYKKEKQEREWTDPNENAKYVCHGGKVQCQFCNVPISEIIVTSTTVLLQDKPWATVKDKNGLVNLNFTGLCMHPSQQKPMCPPPPCKAVINLGEWKNYSETKIDNMNALVVQSTIPCMISGQDLKIVHSGQRAELGAIEPKAKLVPRIIESYWMNEDDERIETIEPNKRASLVIRTEDYKKKDELKITLPINGEEREYVTSVNSEGIAILENIFVYEANHLKKEPRIIEAYWRNENGEKISEVYADEKAELFIRTEGYKKGSKVTVTIKKESNKAFELGQEKVIRMAEVNSEGIAIIKKYKSWT